ncbi:MAG: XdhC family protein [Actinomycetota bacterium]|nr:XdhC family protein [Actinomycetota bacterium]
MLVQSLAARVAELRSSRVPFVHARVVLAERPTSAKPGDEALVLADGTIEGFVGGTCAETTVRDLSLALLDSGEKVIVRITPVAENAPLGTVDTGGPSGRVVVHNPCFSGGTLEVFLDPVVPEPLIVVVGSAPIAEALIAVGAQVGYQVEAYNGAIPADAAAVVVASHGRGEERALTAALEAGVSYVGLVASARRGRAVLDSLILPETLRERVRTPAGMDIGARSPGEVAVSVLAEIVAARPQAARPAVAVARPAVGGIDPVCPMTVAAGTDALQVTHDGRTVWFCGTGCRQAFLADPAMYAS